MECFFLLKSLILLSFSVFTHNLQHFRTIPNFEVKRQNILLLRTSMLLVLLTRLKLLIEHHLLISKLQLFKKNDLYQFLPNIWLIT